jgi:hypothetical protein
MMGALALCLALYLEKKSKDAGAIIDAAGLESGLLGG